MGALSWQLVIGHGGARIVLTTSQGCMRNDMKTRQYCTRADMTTRPLPWQLAMAAWTLPWQLVTAYGLLLWQLVNANRQCYDDATKLLVHYHDNWARLRNPPYIHHQSSLCFLMAYRLENNYYYMSFMPQPLYYTFATNHCIIFSYSSSLSWPSLPAFNSPSACVIIGSSAHDSTCQVSSFQSPPVW